MNMKANPKIDNFIQDLLFVDEDKGEIAISLRKLVLEIAPSAKKDIKYGGLVFVSDKRLFCGIFIRKKHISVKFDRGAEMQDPDNFLEGSGKNRRPLKIFQPEDIENKKVEYYIKQSFKLYKKKGGINYGTKKTCAKFCGSGHRENSCVLSRCAWV